MFDIKCQQLSSASRNLKALREAVGAVKPRDLSFISGRNSRSLADGFLPMMFCLLRMLYLWPSSSSYSDEDLTKQPSFDDVSAVLRSKPDMDHIIYRGLNQIDPLEPTNSRADGIIAVVIKNNLLAHPALQADSVLSSLRDIVLRFVQYRLNDSSSLCPIHMVRSVEAIKLLCDNGADVNIKAIGRKSAIHLVLDTIKTGGGDACSQDIVMALAAAGCDIGAQDVYGQTPLHIACKGAGDSSVLADVALSLVSIGADVTCLDNENKTAVDYLPSAASDLRRLIHESSFQQKFPLHHAISHGAPLDGIALIVSENHLTLSTKSTADTLPLHAALDKPAPDQVVFFLINAYPDACRVPYGINQKLPVFHAMYKEVRNVLVQELLLHSLPFDIITGEEVPLEQHCFAWTSVVVSDRFQGVVEYVLQKCSKYTLKLSQARDEFGRMAVDIATPAIKQLIMSCQFFHGKYKFNQGSTPEHESETCCLYLAEEHFVTRTPPTSMSTSTLDSVNVATSHVALKFMRNRDQFLREVGLRSRYQLSEDHVVQAVCSYDADNDPAFRQEIEKWGFSEKYQYLVVMPAADRHLQAVLFHENIAATKWEEIVRIMKSVTRSVGYLHDLGILHADIKRKLFA